MIELLAIAKEDGWAFYRKDGRVYLIRPPYARFNLTEVSDATVQEAVSRHGFSAAETELEGFDKLVDHLKSVMAAEAKAQGLSNPNASAELLQIAPPHLVVTFLNRVETELLPSRAFDAAERVLLALLDSEAIAADSGLYKRSVSLLKRCHEEKKRTLVDRERLRTEGAVGKIEKAYPLATRAHGAGNVHALARTIKEQGFRMAG